MLILCEQYHLGENVATHVDRTTDCQSRNQMYLALK